MYEKELERLGLELVKMEDWVKAQGLRVVVLFEGRDAAGKGGAVGHPQWAAGSARPIPTTVPMRPTLCRQPTPCGWKR